MDACAFTSSRLCRCYSDALGDGDDTERDADFPGDGNRPFGRCEPGFVLIERQPDITSETVERLEMHLGHSCTSGGYHLRDTGLVTGYDVQVALGHHHVVAAADTVLGQVQAVDMATLVV